LASDDTRGDGYGAWRTALSLGGVLALIVAGGGLLRRWARSSGSLAASAGAGGRSPAGIIEILGRYPIARGQTLLLIKIERRVLLACQTASGRGSAGGVSVLTQIDDPDEVASILLKSRDSEGEALARRFEATLRAFDERMDAPGQARAASAAERPASASVRRRLARLRAGVSA
jgi:flagellar biogenesis protein FliO